MKVLITDEFSTVWEFESESASEISEIVQKWLENREETPIYEITIQIP